MRILLSTLLALSYAPPALAYEANVYWWAEDQLPVPIELVRPGSEDLGEQGTEDAVLDALDAWVGTACTSLTYEFRGWVDEPGYGDGVVQIEWLEADTGMKDAAAATMIQNDPEQGRIVDVNIAFNGETFTWVHQDSNPYLDILDTRAVLLHEFGHLFGLDHNMEMVEATMFWAYTSAAGGYLSWDDKWGICTLYPGEGDECEVDADCPEHPLQPYRCREIEELGRKVCEELYDELGACCDADWNNCGGALCYMTGFNYAGYCTDLCETEDDCPPTWSCDPIEYLGEETGICVSPLGTSQPCGDEFVWPEGDDDDSAADDDDSAADDDDSAEQDGEGGGCGCRQGPAGGGLAAIALLVGLAYRRR